jgi:hypothetical protein
MFLYDVLNEDWIKYRMVRSHRLLSLVLVAIGVGRRIQKVAKALRVIIGTKCSLAQIRHECNSPLNWNFVF